MKTIFRFANMGLFLATIIALGAVAGLAQDPCTDADGQGTLWEKFRAQYPAKDIPGRQQAIETGKQYLEKYGSCESAKDQLDYLKVQIPRMEDSYKKAVAIDIENKLVARFNTALNSKNWDEVYGSGKDLLANYGDKYRDVEIVLGSIGYDESFKGNFKYNDQTLRYARMSIADLESGKTFSANYGVPKDFVYRSKDNTIGWMNLIIGYITGVAQKNKKDALPYLYKATQANSDTNKNPIPYEHIGNYYFEELDKLITEIPIMGADQKITDTPEVAKAKADAIKGKIALANGTSERAMDAFSRAYSFGAAKLYKDKMHKKLEDAYKLRFDKTAGLDAWIADAVKKPLINPTTPVTPISDPEPVVAPTTTPATTPSTVKPPAKPFSAPGKPAGAAPGKKPATKRQSSVKKPVTKKRGV